MNIWADELLDQLATDAEQQINQDLAVLYHRFCFATVSGTSVYTLPAKVRGIKRITWRGKKLEPASWEELEILSPATVVVSPTTKIETSISEPWWYALHPTNVHDIRFYPTPNETFDATGDPYSPTTGPKCIIACWRNIDLTDSTASLPTYIDRRTRKSYILWKAFEKDGKGQNLTAAKFYKQKYNFLIEQFRSIDAGAYVSKKYSLGDGLLSIDQYRYPRPTLNPRFERVIY